MALTCEQVAYAGLGDPAKRQGEELLWCCPYPERHKNGDQHPSLSINTRKNTWGCFVCGFKGTAMQLAAFLAKVDPSNGPAIGAWLREKGLSSADRLTLAEYAKAKNLPEQFLKEHLGLADSTYPPKKKDGKPALLIPYYDEQWNVAARRWRLSLSGDDKFRWEKGSQSMPYGLPLLESARNAGYVVIVEGESDCHVLWYHNIPAIGIPGASNFKDEWADYFKGISVVYAVIEPDRGGENLQDKLLFSDLRDRLKLIRLDLSKDPSELYLRDPAAFLDAWDAAAKAATVPPRTDGIAVLEELVLFIRRFVFLSAEQTYVVALWVLHTQTLDAFDFTPYLAINSAEKRSGKTLLLEILVLFVRKPWLTGRTSAAALVRKVAAQGVTLELDESDAAFNGPEEYSEALRGILNAGNMRGGVVSLCVGKGAEIEVKDFPVFGAKAIAGIGVLPDTVADRSIPIRLKRKARGDKVDRFRKRVAARAAQPIIERIKVWAATNVEALRTAWDAGEAPALPDCLSDRQQDSSEPLCMIADLVGGLWPARIRDALVKLFGSNLDSESAGTKLLGDIKAIFDSAETESVASQKLCDELVGIETSPWAQWSKGKQITPQGLAYLLKRYEIFPETIRTSEKVFKGYRREDFADAWDRYLPSQSEASTGSCNDSQVVTSLQPAPDAASERFSGRYTKNDVTTQKTQIPAPDAGCNDVTTQNANIRQTEHAKAAVAGAEQEENNEDESEDDPDEESF